MIDIQDAFMSLGVHPSEHPRTLAPNAQEGSQYYYMFVALLFRFKTAPLLYSRVASLLSRLLQSLVQGHEAQHQTYLDDAFWVLQGSLKVRNLVLSMLLHTCAALGFKVALKKGERSTQVQWIGVRFSLVQDNLIVGVLEKFMKEVLQVLKSWAGRGMAPVKELRRLAGKLSWMSGILTRTRWVVSVFYRGSCVPDCRTLRQAERQLDVQNAMMIGSRIPSSPSSSWNKLACGWWSTSKQHCCAQYGSSSWTSASTPAPRSSQMQAQKVWEPSS